MVYTSEMLILDLLRLQPDYAQRALGYITRPGAVPNGSFIQLPPIRPSIIEPWKRSWSVHLGHHGVTVTNRIGPVCLEPAKTDLSMALGRSRIVPCPPCCRK